ncbi:MAG: alpha/beta fold hydrolase [Nocardioides sp.]
MKKGRLLGLAGVGVGAAVAALSTGVVVERRVVKARRAGSRGADELGGLRGTPAAVTTDDRIRLHAEVDEVAPYADRVGARTGKARSEQPTHPATVVFVHGYALSLDCWHFQRLHFRGKRRMVFYDQRSHGQSDRSPTGHASIDQLGHDLAAVLEQLVPEGPVVLVGHSMGGMSILAFAEHHPDVFGERVAGVALVSTTAGGLRSHKALSRWIPDVVGSQVAPRLMAGLARAPELIDSARRRGSNIGFLVTDRFAFGDEVPSSYVEFVDEMLAGTSFDVLAEFFPNFDTLDKFKVLSAFAAVPTTIVCGTKDLLTSVGHSRKMASQIPGAQLIEVEGAGHMVILERKERVNAALDALVAAADAAGTAAGR